MGELRYTVGVTFPDQRTADDWLRWLRAGHIAKVISGGATEAEVFRLDGSAIAYEVVYRFPDRGAFIIYERDYAPRLREEGRRLFPPESGIVYTRGTALSVESLHSID